MILRRSSSREERIKHIQVGNLQIDSSTGCGYLHRPDHQEFALLSFLAANGRVFSDGAGQVWGYNYYGDARTVDEHPPPAGELEDPETRN